MKQENSRRPRNPSARARRAPLLSAAIVRLAALTLTCACAMPLAAQQDTLRPPAAVDTLAPDPTRAPADSATRVRPIAAPVDSVRPISPGGAFMQSLLIPGRGQLTLGKRNAAAFYIAVEALGIGMAIKSYRDLLEAKRLEADSIPVEFEVDTLTGEQRPIRWEPGRFPRERVNARRTHLEDWIALLVFNHLLSAADAYVAANLWDFPARLGVRAVPGSGARGDPARRAPRLEARITGSLAW